jgi:peptidyl-prolyl cis-trans isomerase C
VVRDTLLARGAEARGLDGSPEAKLARESELARRLLKAELATARATPPTEEELRVASARRWLDVDRPEGFRTVHAVVMFKPEDDEAKKARGRAVAAAIRSAVLPVAAHAADLVVGEGAPPSGRRIGPRDDPDPLSGAFREAVLGVPTGGFEVKAEPLPPVALSGRLLVPGEQYILETYSRAASSLQERGALSPIVETTFGAHVIMLLERTPPLLLEGEARLARLGDDIVNERARAAQKKLLADRKDRSWVALDAVGLLELVRVEP